MNADKIIKALEIAMTSADQKVTITKEKPHGNNRAAKCLKHKENEQLYYSRK